MINKKIESQDLKYKQWKINESIEFEKILLIDGDDKLEISKKEALNISEERGLDLVCVSPNSNPPVCKIIDYKKYVFDNNKKKPKKKNDEQKKLRISFKIANNDLINKLEKVDEWAEDGKLVKIELFMKGKENIHHEIALEKCKKIIEKIETDFQKLCIDGDGKIARLNNSFFFFVRKKK